MDLGVRIVLRFVLVPLGYLVAVVAGTLVILFGSWRMGDAVAASNSNSQAVALFGFMFAGPVLLILLLSVMWLPASIGILMSEGFAIRSWMFHAANGAAAAFIGWNLFGYVDDTKVPINDVLPVLAAGIAGGLAYWAIAGWSAGPQRPVFARKALPVLPPTRLSVIPLPDKPSAEAQSSGNGAVT
jgi:hypothetical protein